MAGWWTSDGRTGGRSHSFRLDCCYYVVPERHDDCSGLYGERARSNYNRFNVVGLLTRPDERVCTVLLYVRIPSRNLFWPTYITNVVVSQERISRPSHAALVPTRYDIFLPRSPCICTCRKIISLIVILFSDAFYVYPTKTARKCR